VFLTDRPETATYKNKWGANVNLSHQFTAQSIMISIHRSSAFLIAHHSILSLTRLLNCSSFHFIAHPPFKLLMIPIYRSSALLIAHHSILSLTYHFNYSSLFSEYTATARSQIPSHNFIKS